MHTHNGMRMYPEIDVSDTHHAGVHMLICTLLQGSVDIPSSPQASQWFPQLWPGWSP